MELEFDPHSEEQRRHRIILHGTVDLFMRSGEPEHRCNVKHYSVTKNTINRIRCYLAPNNSSILDLYESLYTITIKNRLITVARNDRTSRRRVND